MKNHMVTSCPALCMCSQCYITRPQIYWSFIIISPLYCYYIVTTCWKKVRRQLHSRIIAYKQRYEDKKLKTLMAMKRVRITTLYNDSLIKHPHDPSLISCCVGGLETYAHRPPSQTNPTKSSSLAQPLLTLC